jgi:hypothetical protein
MSMLVPRPCLLAVLCPVLLLAEGGACRAQPQPVDERLFLIYALEDLYRTTWPADRPRALHARQVQHFLALRRLQLDQMRRRIETTTKDPELLQSLKDYQELLGRADALGDKLQEREERYYAFFSNLRKRVLGADAMGKSLVTLKSLGSASDAIGTTLRTPFTDFGDSLASGLFAGLTTYAMAQARHQMLMNARWRDAEAQARDYARTNLPLLLADRARVNKEFFDTFDPARQEAAQKAAERIKELAGKYSWEPAETVFDPAAALAERSGQPRNPFRARAQAFAVLGSKDDKSREDPKVLAALANECLAALRLLPDVQADYYKDQKAQLCFLAGSLATEACKAEIGLTGFKEAQKTPAQAAPLAQRAWKLYFTCEKPDGDPYGMALHRAVLALAYGGKLNDALTILNQNDLSKLRSGNPTFWFDAARILSLSGSNFEVYLRQRPSQQNPVTLRQLKKMQTDSVFCLRMALGTGWSKPDQIKTSPDLEWVRAAAGTEFEKLIGLTGR